MIHNVIYVWAVYVRFHIGWSWERNILLSVWKPLTRKHILKTLRGSLKRNTQRGQYRLCGSEETESWTGWARGGVPTRTLLPKGDGLRGLTLIEEGNECQRERCPEWGGLWDPTLVGEENETLFQGCGNLFIANTF